MKFREVNMNGLQYIRTLSDVLIQNKFIFVCVCMYVRMYACMHVCVCMYVCMYVFMYVCMQDFFIKKNRCRSYLPPITHFSPLIIHNKS
jgi:hypothetical protein